PRDRLDAPRPRRNTGFRDDREQPDVAGCLYMRAAAEFHAEAWNGDHSHFVAVFFAKQRHRTGSDGFLRRFDRGLDGTVLEDMRVDDLLDLQQFVPCQRVEVHEVEAEPVGRHERSGLLHMGAEDLTQCRMEQVCRRVIASCGVASRRVDFGNDRRSDRDLAALHAYTMRANSTGDVLDVADARAEAEVVAERSHVRDLTAALQVERRALEYHPAGITC